MIKCFCDSCKKELEEDTARFYISIKQNFSNHPNTGYKGFFKDVILCEDCIIKIYAVMNYSIQEILKIFNIERIDEVK